MNDQSQSDSDEEVAPEPRPQRPYETLPAQSTRQEPPSVLSRMDLPTSPPYSPRQFQGCSLVGNYEILKKIGEGTFGEVSLGIHKHTRKKVALKRILIHNEREGMPMTALREIRILKKLRHSNVIRLMEMAVDEKRGVYMVFPYMHHDLDGILQNPGIQLLPTQVKSYAFQILTGLHHLHYHHVLHRDIKTSNILIDKRGRVKLADFGLARPFVQERIEYTNNVVTRWYRAPELLMGDTKYTTGIDVWAVGCVFGEMLKRKAIFPGKTDLEQLQLVYDLCGTPDLYWGNKSYLEMPMFQSGVGDFDDSTRRKKRINEKFPSAQYFELTSYRNETVELLDRLLTLNPAKRSSAAQALEFDYFKGHIDNLTGIEKDWKESHEWESRNEKMKRFESGTRVHLKHHYDVVQKNVSGYRLPTLKK